MRSRMSIGASFAAVPPFVSLALGQVTRVNCSHMLAGMNRVRPA
jgi:hypothetical protein